MLTRINFFDIEIFNAKKECIMTGRFDDFENTELGLQLDSLINQKDRLIEMKAFSREGFPAVTALVSEMGEVLKDYKKTDIKKFNFAKQFVGDRVAKIMREAGYKKIKTQKSVPGKLFTVGAVWGPKT
ncbi:MAG: hypothetical protein COZ43_00285 [Sphingomonadales bacterium CG_4_10_14_3_um_filter_58_15]|nr:MAG: hypothetical protein COZ43_00285 [Sphingomonadales bacterium CG_4_10_14_3_um_filter_58_15]